MTPGSVEVMTSQGSSPDARTELSTWNLEGRHRCISRRVLVYFFKERSSEIFYRDLISLIFWLIAWSHFLVIARHRLLRHRNLVTSDPSDHSLRDDEVMLIWARGQTPYLFNHRPLSGLESCAATDYDYYRWSHLFVSWIRWNESPISPSLHRINELKYHGTKPSQRGTTLFNFYGRWFCIFPTSFSSISDKFWNLTTLK